LIARYLSGDPSANLTDEQKALVQSKFPYVKIESNGGNLFYPGGDLEGEVT
jgi:hypothetical protein